MLTKHTVLYTGSRFIQGDLPFEQPEPDEQSPPDFARIQSSSGTCNEDKPFF